MNADDMLQAVRQHKENCVEAMISGDEHKRFAAETEAKKFLMENYAMVLDIVDDHLSEKLRR